MNISKSYISISKKAFIKLKFPFSKVALSKFTFPELNFCILKNIISFTVTSSFERNWEIAKFCSHKAKITRTKMGVGEICFFPMKLAKEKSTIFSASKSASLAEKSIKSILVFSERLNSFL